MIQSITFGDCNTWDDWKLVAKERPVFAPPKVKTTTIDIPGGNGSIDLTESLTGYPVYENRTGSFKFYVMNGYGEWQDRYSKIMNYLHGQRMKAVLADDPSYYYYGRFTVEGWSSGDTWSEIEIGYDVEPYKWTVNPYGFSKTINTNEGEWASVINFLASLNTAHVCPTITISEDTYIRFYEYKQVEPDNKTTIFLYEGTTELADWVIDGATSYHLDILGTGNSITISVEFPQGRL